MKFTKFVFPAPKPTYSLETQQLITIPRKPIQELVENMARSPMS